MADEARYDPAMIRDFLRQLKLELQVSLEYLRSTPDQSQSTMSIDLETMNELRKLQTKYDAVLVPKLKLVSEAGTHEEIAAAAGRLNEMALESRGHQVRRLETLQEVIDEALQCCAMRVSQRWPEKKVNVTGLVRKMQQEREEAGKTK